MATLRSTVAGTSFIPVTRPQGAVHGYGFSLAVSANPTANDIWILGKIPSGCALIDFWIDVPDMDSDATGSISLAVGDEEDDDRFVAATTTFKGGRTLVSPRAVTTGQAVGVIAGTVPRTYTENSFLAIKVAVAAVTFAAGTIKGAYYYTDYPKYRDPGQ